MNRELPDLVVTRNGVPLEDQKAGVREFLDVALQAGEAALSGQARFYQERLGEMALILDRESPGKCIHCPEVLYNFVLGALNRADRDGLPTPEENLVELSQMLLHEKQTVARRDRELADLREASIDVLPQKHLERFKRRSLELMAKSAKL